MTYLKVENGEFRRKVTSLHPCTCHVKTFYILFLVQEILTNIMEFRETYL